MQLSELKVGSRIQAGEIPAELDKGVPAEPVFWRVASKDRVRFGGVLLLQEKIHTARPFDSDNGNAWSESDLREWANSTWKSYFSSFLQKQITPQLGDNFFLLSQDELGLLTASLYSTAPANSDRYAQEITEAGVQSFNGFTLRDAIADSVACVDYSTGTPRIIAVPAAFPYHRPRLACVLNSTVFVRWNENGSYYKLAHIPIAVSPVIPDGVGRNEDFTVSWNYALREADLKESILERRDNGGEWIEVYRGTGTEYTQNSGNGRTIQFRLRIEDSEGNVSDWTESEVCYLNKPPTLEFLEISLGIEGNDELPFIYSIADDISNTVKINIKIDGKTVASRDVDCGVSAKTIEETINVITLENGSHTLTIEAKDEDGGISTFSEDFDKNVRDIILQSIPIGEGSDAMPTAARLSVEGNFNDFKDEAGYAFLFEVCNNGLDESPTWQDATENVLDAKNIIFTNTTKTAEKWLPAVRITIHNPTTRTLYINSISGSTATA